MQGAVGIITLVLVTLLAIVFLTVLRRASAPAVPGATADPGRFRAPLFWLLVVVGIGVSYGTLVEWPYGPGPATSGEPVRTDVGKSRTTIRSARDNTTACSIAVRSSRTLPGHE